MPSKKRMGCMSLDGAPEAGPHEHETTDTAHRLVVSAQWDDIMQVLNDGSTA